MTEVVAAHPEGSSKAPRVSFFTLGCRLNQHDTAAMRATLSEAGYRESVEPGDVVIVNTCTVTRRADQEARQLVRRIHREAPGARIVVTGCYAQRAPEEWRAIPGVSTVLGTAERDDADTLLAAVGAGPRFEIAPGRIRRSFTTPAPLHVGRSRALLKIQDGCDSFCTYCVVPYVRGRSRSLPIEEALERAWRLLEAGFREIVLTGADLGDYEGLAGLVEAMLALGDRDHRVRLSSIEPHKLDPGIVAMLGSEPRLCRHLHLPLQSGSNAILKSMRRGYTAEEYEALLGRVAARATVAIGADVIVGFPGEDEAAFQETLGLVERSPITFLHVFRYSPRPGTAAARLTAQVPDEAARERASQLRALGEAKARAFRRSLLGSTLAVVWERGMGRYGRVAMSDLYVPVEVEGSTQAIGIFQVRTHDQEGDRLVGTPT
ncbi:MAG TPA: tRNA (N(6)-L-threonylcarbamoyladenosine(37)-C(2))-methylthiotransferase MtaB [Candidatus Polarisedimenticolia bacterium]|nr:tRNA (N(6)-L-threonylcarbamoyladenosine(37)-C(2))-methylthiotransferase MtaB [Candidatus Polarisedimenticolia bacterium]